MEHFGGILHDEDERRKWQNPESILAEIGLRRCMMFMDIGCGQGFFTIPTARIVGNAEKIYDPILAKPTLISFKKRLPRMA